MNDLVRAELLKLRVTRSSRWTMVAVLASVGVAVASAIATAGRGDVNLPLDTVEGVRNVLYAGASSGGVAVFVLGLLAMTGEHRFQTVTQTFLVSPVRTRVVGAKLVAYALVGAALGVMCGALTMAIGLPWLAGEGASPRLVQDVGLVLAGTVVTTVVYGVLGVAVGALFRNQTVAVVLSLLWMFGFEAVLVGFFPVVGRWQPRPCRPTPSAPATCCPCGPQPSSSPPGSPGSR